MVSIHKGLSLAVKMWDEFFTCLVLRKLCYLRSKQTSRRNDHRKSCVFPVWCTQAATQVKLASAQHSHTIGSMRSPQVPPQRWLAPEPVRRIQARKAGNMLTGDRCLPSQRRSDWLATWRPLSKGQARPQAHSTNQKSTLADKCFNLPSAIFTKLFILY